MSPVQQELRYQQLEREAQQTLPSQPQGLQAVFGPPNPQRSEYEILREGKQFEAERQRIKDELQRIADERTRIFSEQQDEMRRLQQAQSQAVIDQEQATAELQAQGTRQRQSLEQARLSTQAAAASMRVLQGGSRVQGPTAQTSGRGRAVTRPRTNRASQSLRIGGTAADPGVGMNIGG